MSQWKRGQERDVIELAADTPDAQAALDEDGKLIGWDESASNAFLIQHGLDGDTSSSV